MSEYEFFCHACGQTFSKTLESQDYREGSIVCPHCGSENVERRLLAFYAANRKENA